MHSCTDTDNKKLEIWFIGLSFYQYLRNRDEWLALKARIEPTEESRKLKSFIKSRFPLESR